ncbi:hypothetical protein LTR53_012752 [Teratosphaeriaceae sp. CCFEE 6253]|nr:hypothetical protein LTR53_012752 [Teratosphaeriaceae sp. CCFEE 6253]
MSALTETDHTKVSTDAAERFVDSYYSALGGARSSIKTFYVPTTMPPNGRGLPSITYNGELMVDSAVFQERWEKEMPRVHFEVQSVNVHVLNPALRAEVDMKKRKEAERNMSLIVQASGSQTSTTHAHHITNSTMRCHKPDTDQEVTLRVYANDVPCIEYILPASATTDPNVVECFVPVAIDDELSIRGTMSGSCLHGSFDLIADGSFLADKRIEGPKSGNVRHYTNRKVVIRPVFDAPKSPGYASVHPPDRIVDGHLRVKALSERADFANSVAPVGGVGVGSLVIIVSLNQHTDENYVDRYRSLTCGDPDISREHIQDGGLAPEHELWVKPMEGKVTEYKQSKHKRHAEQTRFGKQPWAKLIFYYRSKEAIQAAGCVVQDGEESIALEADDDEMFVPATVEGKNVTPKKDEKAKQTDQSGTAQPGGSDSTLTPTEHNMAATQSHSQAKGGALVRPALSTSRAAKGTAPAPAALSNESPPKKLMGQSLNLPTGFAPSSLIQPVSFPTTEDDFNAAMQQWQRTQPADQARRRHAPAADGVQETTELQDLDEDELADTLADTEILLGGSFPDEQVAPVAQMAAPGGIDVQNDGAEMPTAGESEQMETIMHVKVEEQSSPAPTDVGNPQISSASLIRNHPPTATAEAPIAMSDDVEMQDMPDPHDTHDGDESVHHESSPQPVGGQRGEHSDKPSRCQVDVAEIRMHVPADGITLLELKRRFNQHRIPHEATVHFRELLQSVAFLQEGRYYPKTTLSHAPGTQLTEAMVEQQRGNETSPVAIIKAEPEEATTHHSFVPEHPRPSVLPTIEVSTPAQPIALNLSRPERADSPITLASSSLLNPSSRKRTASLLSTSRDSNPSSTKKLRFDALAARKAELKRQLQDKQTRKAAAQVALEEQQRLREREEEEREMAEEREIAALERLVEEEGERVVGLEGMVEEEGVLLREAREARERAELGVGPSVEM